MRFLWTKKKGYESIENITLFSIEIMICQRGFNSVQIVWFDKLQERLVLSLNTRGPFCENPLPVCVSCETLSISASKCLQKLSEPIIILFNSMQMKTSLLLQRGNPRFLLKTFSFNLINWKFWLYEMNFLMRSQIDIWHF